MASCHSNEDGEDGDDTNDAWRVAFTSDPDFHTARALLQRKGDIKALTHAYMCVFGDQFLNLVRTMVESEVSNVSDAHAVEMMRGNSACMKILSEVAYVVGTDYLRDVLAGPMAVLFHLQDTLEVNHAIVHDDMTLAAHRAQLESLAQTILDRLVCAPFPPLLAAVCLYLRRSVATRFHAHSDSILGGFLFLRVVCPVIVMPCRSSVFPHVAKASLPPHALRSSILVAKLLQNLANNAFFKEDYMAPFNPFIRRNFPTVVAFYDRICDSVDAATSPTTRLETTTSLLTVDEAWKIIQDHMDRPLEVAVRPAARRMSSGIAGGGPVRTSAQSSVTLSLDRPKQKPSISELERLDSTSRVLHRTNYGTKLPRFLLWCCMQLQDACELESVFYPPCKPNHSPSSYPSSPSSHAQYGDVPAAHRTLVDQGDASWMCALVFQVYKHLPPVAGVVRSSVLSSGFVLQVTPDKMTRVTFTIRMDEDVAPLKAKPYQKQLLTLAKLKLAIERST
ncbi:hypothetical protein DYB38_003132 [Aphanomyces astaci]|uniref:Ras-GAP domain-containing protein n=1 Tax=Aphanomyces astaci TaxID=112090 RepID=A0A397D5Q2_APHAT|nr:hypothetical protein DYB38_003132 [Aphanomyces astaci]